MQLRITVVEAPRAHSADYAKMDDVYCFDVSRDVRVYFGRSPRCEVSLASVHLGRRHGEVSIQDGEVWLRDMYTTNGTYVDGVDGRVERIQVTAGPPTVVRIADVLLALEIVPTTAPST